MRRAGEFNGRRGRHWSYLPAGFALSVLLIVFWYFNQSYLTPGQGPVARFLENPLPTFGLIIYGAFVAAYLGGDFAVKVPLTFEPLLLALAGGAVAGAGSVVAGMSVNSVVLFNLAGVFTLPAFMITQGWIYLALMIAGGALASRLLLTVTLKMGQLKREITVPGLLTGRKSRRSLFLSLAGLFAVALAAAAVVPGAAANRGAIVIAMCLMVAFGFVVERGTVCMSSMLKELFISHSPYVWRTVLFTIMCLALLYRLGLQAGLYPFAVVATFVTAPVLLMVGSFVMGVGFVFADGCFIGSLWKAGQGNVVNVVGMLGLVAGIGGARLLEGALSLPVLTGAITNQLSAVVTPWVLLGILWVGGTSLLLVFRVKRYRY
jgi:uncharacterized membrane protein YedE/YeeE